MAMLGQYAVQLRLGGRQPCHPARARCTQRPQRLHPATSHSASQGTGSSSPQQQQSTAVSEALLAQRARQFYEEVWSTGRVTLLDEIMAEDHQQMDWVWQPQRAEADPMTGRKQMKRGVLAYRAAYPDMRFTIEACVADAGNAQVFVHWHACGTNTGPMRERPPTGAVSRFSGISRLCFDGAGRIRRSHVYRQAPSDEAAYFLGRQQQPPQQEPAQAQAPSDGTDASGPGPGPSTPAAAGQAAGQQRVGSS